MTIYFVNFGVLSDGSVGSACDPETGLAQTAVIKGRAGRRWKTARRLRLGHSERQIRRRHRRATNHRNGWWLYTARTQIGDCPARGCLFPVVRAKVSRGRVSSFRIIIGAAGD